MSELRLDQNITADEAGDALRDLIESGKEKGYLTYSQVNDHLPDEANPEKIDQFLMLVQREGIELIDESEVSEREQRVRPFAEIVEKINALAGSHRIGSLQKLRQQLQNKSKLPSRKLLFTKQKFIDNGWTYHVGGRTELQFNVGLETLAGLKYLRHGVGFSFQRTKSLTDLTQMKPKVGRFNEFLRVNPDEFQSMRMWHWRTGGGARLRSQPPDQRPAPVLAERIEWGVFVFLGRLQRADSLDYEAILDDLDRLLPLYEFVESDDAAVTFPALTTNATGFDFRPGCTTKRERTTATVAEQQLDVDLRHNQLQQALHGVLVSRFGEKAVGSELPSGNGGRVDAVVSCEGGYWFYEIKTALSARACIREALAQLLDYSFWPGGQEAARHVIVGEPELDGKAGKYLELLRQRFSLPIHYQQLKLEPKAALVPADL
jgi:hypothetical protein